MCHNYTPGMDIAKISIVLYITFVTKGTTGSTLFEYWTSPQNASWTTALNYCKQEFNGTLYSHDDGEAEDGFSLQASTTYWTRKYSVMSSWVTVEGCYSHMGTSPFGRERHLAKNSPILCQVYCSSSQMFALKGDTCVCITNSLPSSVSQLQAASCDVKCEESVYFCGGRTSYSVYKRVVFTKDNTTSENKCVAAQCQNSHTSQRQLVYYGQNCTEKHTPVCNTEHAGQLFLVNQTYRANWTDAFSTCFSENNTTMVSFSGVNCNAKYSSLLGNKFWIAVFRNIVILTTSDVPGGILQKCYAFRKSSQNGTKEEPRSCTDSLPFICQYTSRKVPGFTLKSTTASSNSKTTGNEGRSSKTGLPSYTSNSPAQAIQNKAEDCMRKGPVAGAISFLVIVILIQSIMLIYTRRRFRKWMRNFIHRRRKRPSNSPFKVVANMTECENPVASLETETIDNMTTDMDVDDTETHVYTEASIEKTESADKQEEQRYFTPAVPDNVDTELEYYPESYDNGSQQRNKYEQMCQEDDYEVMEITSDVKGE